MISKGDKGWSQFSAGNEKRQDVGFYLNKWRIFCGSDAVNQIACYTDHVRPMDSQRVNNALIGPVMQISKQGDTHVDRCVKVVDRFLK
jgi:hypothetical protein